jgi:hypothetical protein
VVQVEAQVEISRNYVVHKDLKNFPDLPLIMKVKASSRVECAQEDFGQHRR